jgi:hypothetical protein
MKVFKSETKKRFRKIKTFYVGQEAERMLDEGKRLTAAAQSPQWMDLSRRD